MSAFTTDPVLAACAGSAAAGVVAGDAVVDGVVMLAVGRSWSDRRRQQGEGRDHHEQRQHDRGLCITRMYGAPS